MVCFYLPQKSPHLFGMGRSKRNLFFRKIRKIVEKIVRLKKHPSLVFTGRGRLGIAILKRQKNMPSKGVLLAPCAQTSAARAIFCTNAPQSRRARRAALHRAVRLPHPAGAALLPGRPANKKAPHQSAGHARPFQPLRQRALPYRNAGSGCRRRYNGETRPLPLSLFSRWASKFCSHDGGSGTP